MKKLAVISSCFLFAIIGCGEETIIPSGEPKIIPNMKQQITELIRTYESALNASDTAIVMSLYGSEPVFLPQHSSALNGREAVEAGYNHVFTNIKLDVTFTIHEIEVLGDLAYGRTTSAGKTRLLKVGATVSKGNNELFIFRKEGGQWKIHRYIFATSNPPPAN